jgi:hypothetical protein
MLFCLRRQDAGLSDDTLSSSRGSRVGRYRLWSLRCWGDSESSLSYTKKIKECLYPFKLVCERFNSEAPGAIDFVSVFQNLPFYQYPSSPAELPNEFNITQGVRVSVRLNDFFCDETPGANLIHPGSLGLGFARGVSLFLTLNKFKLEYDSLFQVTKCARRRGESPKD